MKSKSLNTLKDYAKFRLLNDTIDSIKAKYGETLGYYILVVDTDSLKVLSSVCKLYDLISYKISTVERLNLTRKQFPTSEAIYLITPTKESVELILNDFKNPSSPQYNFAHLCFMGSLSEELMSMISQSSGLVPRIKTLRELNLNFMIKEADVFHFGLEPNLTIFNPKDNSSWVSDYAERLLTVCCTLMEVPYIQYYGGSFFCKNLAMSFQRSMNELVKKAGSTMRPHEPKGTVIIMDRPYDMNSPIMHDYCYESIIYDIINVDKDGAIDLNKLTSGKEESKGESNIMYVGDSDPLWNKYRYLHIGEVFKKLAVDVKEFAKTSKKMDLNTKDMSKLQEVMSSMPNHKEMVGSCQFHSRIAQECSTAYTAMGHVNLIKLEQEIITGLDDKGSELDSKTIINSISRISLDFPKMSDENKLRLYLLYINNFDVPKRDAEFFTKDFINPSYKDIVLSKLIWLNHIWPGPDVKKPQRKEQKMLREDFELYKERMNKSKLAEIMYLPKIAKVALEASHKSLKTLEFPFLGDVPKDYGKAATKATGGLRKMKLAMMEEEKDDDSWSQPRIILFVIGGISHQEITSLFKLKNSGKINCPLTVGSDCIVTPKMFIDSIGRMDEVRLNIGA